MWPCIVNLVDKRAENSMGSLRFHCDWAFPCPGLPMDATEQQQCVQDTPRCSVRGSVYPAEGRRPSFHFSQSDALGPMGSCEKVSCASSWTIAKAQHRNSSLFLTLYPVCLPTSHLSTPPTRGVPAQTRMYWANTVWKKMYCRFPGESHTYETDWLIRMTDYGMLKFLPSTKPSWAIFNSSMSTHCPPLSNLKLLW